MSVRQTSWGGGNNFFRTIPVTKYVIIAMVAVFFLSLIGQQWAMFYLAYLPFTFPQAITGLATYPLAVGSDILGVFLNGLMLFWFGGGMERQWGSRTYLLFLIGAGVCAALLWLAGNALLAVFAPGSLQDFGMAGPWLTISSLVVAWVLYNPGQTVLLWFVLPIKAKWIGWATVIMVYLLYPYYNLVGPSPLILILGFFALGGVIFAYFFVWYQRQWAWIARQKRTSSRASHSTIRHPSSGLLAGILRPWREWQRRRRVAKLNRTFRIDD